MVHNVARPVWYWDVEKLGLTICLVLPSFITLLLRKYIVVDVARLRVVEFRHNVECPKSCDIGYDNFRIFHKTEYNINLPERNKNRVSNRLKNKCQHQLFNTPVWYSICLDRDLESTIFRSHRAKTAWGVPSLHMVLVD